jgi:hypothetical protein
MSILKGLIRLVGLVVLILLPFAIPYAGFAALTWYRYGSSGNPAGSEPGDLLIDRFMPVYEVEEWHQTSVDAPANVTLAAARELDVQASPVNQAIIIARSIPGLLRGNPNPEPQPSSGLLAQTLAMGWGLLAEEPGEIVVGAVTQPWNAVGEFRRIPPDEFVAFDEPGYAKIVFTIAAEDLGPGVSLATTRTRVTTTDAESRERFRRYWSLVSPGMLIIRFEALRMLRSDAERRGTTPSDSI